MVIQVVIQVGDGREGVGGIGDFDANWRNSSVFLRMGWKSVEISGMRGMSEDEWIERG